MFVRTRWASDLNDQSRRALQELAEFEQARVTADSTGTVDEELRINATTAVSLIRKGYADLVDADHVAVTREGLVKIGKVTISRSERRRAKEAEALDAQASGEWRPVPAGYSAEAERDAKDSKRFWAQAVSAVRAAKEDLAWERKMLKLTELSGEADEAELEVCREDVEKAEARLAQAKVQLESLKGEQQRAA